MTKKYLIGRGGQSKGAAGSSFSETPNTLQTRATARLIEIISHGECVGLADRDNPLKSVYMNGTPVQNTNGTYNYSGLLLQERLGLPNQPPFEGFDEVESIQSVSGQTLLVATPRVFTVSNPDVDAIKLIVQIDALTKQDQKNSKLLGSRIEFRLSTNVNGGAYTTIDTIGVSDKCTSPQQLTYRIQKPLAAVGTQYPWSVKVTRTSPESNSVLENNSAQIIGINEITESKLQYSDLAGVAITADSKQFGTNIPTRAFDWVGLILDVPSNYDAPDYNDPCNESHRSYAGLWDGTFKRAWTDNPAWILWAMLTDKDWGLGRVIKPEYLDKWALYQIAQYCDEFVDDGYGGTEPRYRVNTQVTQGEEAYSMLQSIASAFRGMIFWGPGAATFMADMPSDPVKLVSPANVLGGQFTYQGSSLKSRHSVVRVTWNDPNDQFRATIEVVEDPEMMDRFGWRPRDVIAYGCTSRGAARRMGRWILDTEKYQTEVVAYKASMDHADIKPGDIVQIHDPYYAGLRTAGRATAVTSTSMSIDSPLEVEVGKAYSISMLRPDGSLIERQLTNLPGETSTLTWTDSIVDLPSTSEDATLFVTSPATQRAKIYTINSNEITFHEAVTINQQYDYTIYFTLPDGTVVTREVRNPILTGMLPFQNYEDYQVKGISWSESLEEDEIPETGTTVFLGVAGEGFYSLNVGAVTDTYITAIPPIEYKEGFTYELTLTAADGSLIKRPLKTTGRISDSYHVWDESLTALPLVGSMWGVTTSSIAPRQFRVVSVAESAPNIFDVTALYHDPNKYARIEENLTFPPDNDTIYKLQAVPAPSGEITATLRPITQQDGSVIEQIVVLWEPSPDSLVSHYKFSYQFEDNPWVSFDNVVSPSFELNSLGPGVYYFQVIAVGINGREGSVQKKTLELLDTRPFEGATISRIRIQASTDADQASDVSFTGKDLKLQWNVLPPSDWVDPDLDDWEDPYLKYYRVRLLKTDNTVMASFYTYNRHYTLTREQNAEVNSSVPLRQFKVGVAMVDTFGNTYDELKQTFNNPAPAAPTVALTKTATGVIITVSACTDLDYSGTKVWITTTDGFDPLVVSPTFNGIGYTYTHVGVVGTTYYVRAAHFDDYSSAPSELNISAQSSIIVDGVVSTDLDTTPPAVPTGLVLSSSRSINTDGTELIQLAFNWNPVLDSDIAGYELEVTQGSTVNTYSAPAATYSVFATGNLLYSAKVKSVDKLSNKSAYSSAVTHTTLKDTTAPSAPSAVSVAGSVTSLTISWTNPAASDLSLIRIYEATSNVGGASATQIAEMTATSGTSGQYTRSGLTTGATRYYWLVAVDRSGNTSLYSTVASGSTSAITGPDVETTPPAVPTGLGLASGYTLNVEGSQVVTLTVTWSAVGDSDLDHYEIAVQEAGGSFIEYNVGTSLTYKIYTIPNTSYVVKVRAVDKFGNRSSYSSTVSHTTTYDTTAPSAPTSLSVVAGLTSLTISWTNPSAGDLSEIIIYENTTNTSGTATQIATIGQAPSTTGSWTRGGLATGVTRYYWLKARDFSGNLSAFSLSTNGTTSAVTGGDFDTTAPAVPAGLALSSAVSTDTDGSQIVRLTASWSAVADSDFDHYEISLQEGAGDLIETAVGTALKYIFTVKGNTSYTAKIRAADKTGNRSAYSSTVSHTTTTDTTAPGLPTSISATAGFQLIKLTWTNPTAIDLSHIEIWENTTNTSGTATRIDTIDSVSATAGGYTRSGLANSIQRYYFLKAVDTSGNASGFTSSVNATTLAVQPADMDTTAPATPTGLAISSSLNIDTDGKQRVVLVATWTANGESDLAGYHIELTESGSTVTNYTAPSNRMEWVVRGNVGFTARIRAFDTFGNKSSYSSATSTHITAKDTTAPAVATSVAAAGMLNQISLTWTNPSDTDLVAVEVWEHSSAVSESATKIATRSASPGAPGMFVRAGLGNSTTRYYWLKSVDTSGNVSGFSSSASATTQLITTAEVGSKAVHAVAGVLNTNKYLVSSISASSGSVSGVLETVIATVTGDPLEISLNSIQSVPGDNYHGYYLLYTPTSDTSSTWASPLTFSAAIDLSTDHELGGTSNLALAGVVQYLGRIILRSPGSGSVREPISYTWLIAGMTPGTYKFIMCCVNRSGSTIEFFNRYLSVKELKRCT